MKTFPLVLAALCSAAQASDITVDIFGVGSYTTPGTLYSPELDFHSQTLDWRPFGLTYFDARIRGSFTVVTPGVDTLDLYWAGSPLNFRQGSNFYIDGTQYLFWESDGAKTRADVSLVAGSHTFELDYTPPVAETNIGSDVISLPTGKNGVAIIDEDHSWGPTSSVPESTWPCWLVPAGLLLLRRKQ